MGQANGKEKADSASQTVDGGYLIPQGVYSSVQDYDHIIVKALIQTRKLAPFYPGLDDEKAYAQAPFNTECPICFLHYPSPLDKTRCCSQPICTECFVQIKRADPNHTNPPSSEPAACPYCQETNFGIIYKAPAPGLLTGDNTSGAGVAEGAEKAREQAEESAERKLAVQNKRKSFGHQDPDVITTDEIRPDWQAKLTAAEATTTRRANRRIIMRQVGDRLIPVGVSSSRLGTDLPPGSTAGPGGAIIIGENSRWGSSLLSTVAGGGRERRGSRNRRDLAHLLQGLGDGGADMEEIMMMEAMRLSLLEHEEQQRREAQAQSRQEGSGNNEEQQTAIQVLNQDSSSFPSNVDAGGASRSTIQSQQQQHTKPRTSSLSSDAAAPTLPPVTRYAMNTQEFGLSSAMMAELSELVEGGSSTPSTSNSALPSTTPSTPPSLSPAQPILRSLNKEHTASSGTPTSMHPSNLTPTASPIGSPSRMGTNPNNPFRRLAGSASNSPSHSRQNSTLNPTSRSSSDYRDPST